MPEPRQNETVEAIELPTGQVLPKERQAQQNTFNLTPSDAWTLSAFLQDRMKDEESVDSGIGAIAHRLYHWCRDNPDL